MKKMRSRGLIHRLHFLCQKLNSIQKENFYYIYILFHYFNFFIHIYKKPDTKNGWVTKVTHPTNKQTRLKVLEGVNKLYGK